MHLGEHVRILRDKGQPVGVLEQLRTGLHARFAVRVVPHMEHLVGLRRLAAPDADGPAAGAGVLTVMVPVVCAHVVGCVGVTVGAAGVAGWGLITTLADAVEVHPVAFVTVYV